MLSALFNRARVHLSLAIVGVCIETRGSRIYFREELHNNGANRAGSKGGKMRGSPPRSRRKEIWRSSHGATRYERKRAEQKGNPR